MKTLFHALFGWCRLDRRGAVAIMFAVSAIPLAICTGVAVDFSRIVSARSAMQRAVDNAALTGAAAYVLYSQGDTFNAVARNMATSAFCNATTTIPAGFTIDSGGSNSCTGMNGPTATASIGAVKPGTRGVVSGSGCSPTNTVISGVTCGFVVTVSASATMQSIFPSLLGASRTIGVTASAINPFINLATALGSSISGSAKYANSLWVYPLLLDANGSPDYTTNKGALPDRSACTSNPTQTSCGVYTMLASTLYYSCTTANPCTVNGSVFGGTGGVIQNPTAGTAVITATTPLGFAFESTSGVPGSYGYDRACLYYQTCTPPKYQQYQGHDVGCVYPWINVYNTVSQIYYANGNPVLPWSLPTHWFFSSYLANNTAPSYDEISTQLNTATNPATNLPYNVQNIPPTPEVPARTTGVITPTTCPDVATPASAGYHNIVTTYPTTGKTNCSLYVVRDPTSLSPDPSLASSTGVCFDPTNTAAVVPPSSPTLTQGQSYAALSCQSFGNHTYAFFWNDMGGGASDNTDYNNGTLTVSCAGLPSVQLIN